MAARAAACCSRTTRPTANGGSNGVGALLRIDPTGAVTLEHSFGGSDGSSPAASVLVGEDGRLYGTAVSDGDGCGTVYRFDPATQAFEVLKAFECSDGDGPFGGLASDGRGTLYGTTSAGGRFGQGTVYSIRP